MGKIGLQEPTAEREDRSREETDEGNRSGGRYWRCPYCCWLLWGLRFFLPRGRG